MPTQAWAWHPTGIILLSFGRVFDGTDRFYSPGPAAVIGVHRPAAAEPCQPHTKYSLVVNSYPADTPAPLLILSDGSGNQHSISPYLDVAFNWSPQEVRGAPGPWALCIPRLNSCILGSGTKPRLFVRLSRQSHSASQSPWHGRVRFPRIRSLTASGDAGNLGAVYRSLQR